MAFSHLFGQTTTKPERVVLWFGTILTVFVVPATLLIVELLKYTL